MKKFRIDGAPVLARRFVVPKGAFKSKVPDPIPDLGNPVAVRLPMGDAPYRYAARTETPKPPANRPAKPLVTAQTNTRGLYTVTAPVGPRKGRTVLDFTAATDSPMASFMGTIQLEINREAVDLGRLESGIMALAVDHDTTRLMGRVTEATVGSGRLDMKAEVGDTPLAVSTLAEIDDLMRQGFSPGFIVHQSELVDESDPSYDPDQFLQIIATKWEPFEISSTSIPRNPAARLKGVASMNSDSLLQSPELLHREDLVGLSLAAGRQILKSAQGSDRQRAKLTEFYKAFDAGLESGLSRDAAATAAKASSGL